MTCLDQLQQEPIVVACLRCGSSRGTRWSETGLEAAECARCGYLGWRGSDEPVAYCEEPAISAFPPLGAVWFGPI
jgi:Zn ribbon nucleic-acid-binding protein